MSSSGCSAREALLTVESGVWMLSLAAQGFVGIIKQETVKVIPTGVQTGGQNLGLSRRTLQMALLWEKPCEFPELPLSFVSESENKLSPQGFMNPMYAVTPGVNSSRCVHKQPSRSI